MNKRESKDFSIIEVYDPREHYTTFKSEFALIQGCLDNANALAQVFFSIYKMIYSKYWNSFSQDVRREFDVDLIGLNGMMYLFIEDHKKFLQEQEKQKNKGKSLSKRLKHSNEEEKPVFSFVNEEELVGHMNDFIATILLGIKEKRYVDSIEREKINRAQEDLQFAHS